MEQQPNTEAPQGAVPLDCRVSDLEWLPILGTPLKIEARLLNEEWAQRNHGQSLKRLADRGGLSLSEAAAIANRTKWRDMSADEAIQELKRAAKRGR